jgi:hypothetical protein
VEIAVGGMGIHMNALALAMRNARPYSTEQEVDIYLNRCLDWGYSFLHAQEMGIDAREYYATLLYREAHGVPYIVKRYIYVL